MKTDVYKTLITGELVQQTAFSIGGNQPHARVDSPVAQDGEGRYIIRGGGLAGAFIAEARKLIADDEFPRSVSSGSPTEQFEKRRREDHPHKHHAQDRLEESAWRFHHAHPVAAPDITLVRAGVGILQATGAAAHGIKFETEAIPAGTRWRFLLEVDEYLDHDGGALALALRTVRQWQQGRCFLGRDVARGLGWMHLDQLKIRRLGHEHALLWHNPEAESPWANLKTLPPQTALDPKSPQYEELTKHDHQREPQRLRCKGSIAVGLDIFSEQEEAPWGLDTLAVGGSEAGRAMQDEALAQQDVRRPANDREADAILAWSAGIDNNGKPLPAEPFIPGSSLRGPLRHALSWWLRSRQDADIMDPNATRGGYRKKLSQDPIARLFGSMKQSAALLISDARLAGDDYEVILLERHAEDEFTGGTCGAQKFDQYCLTRGRFEFQLHIEAPDNETLLAYRNLIDTAAALGAQRQLPLGGDRWSGQGWIQWSIEPEEDA